MHIVIYVKRKKNVQADLAVKTRDYIYPNPTVRAKMLTDSGISKLGVSWWYIRFLRIFKAFFSFSFRFSRYFEEYMIDLDCSVILYNEFFVSWMFHRGFFAYDDYFLDFQKSIKKNYISWNFWNILTHNLLEWINLTLIFAVFLFRKKKLFMKWNTLKYCGYPNLVYYSSKC